MDFNVTCNYHSFDPKYNFRNNILVQSFLHHVMHWSFNFKCGGIISFRIFFIVSCYFEIKFEFFVVASKMTIFLERDFKRFIFPLTLFVFFLFYRVANMDFVSHSPSEVKLFHILDTIQLHILQLLGRCRLQSNGSQ